MTAAGENEDIGREQEGVEPDAAELAQMRMLKAMAHPIRLHLLGVLSFRSELSPAEFARIRDEPVSNVSYHFRALEKLDCIEVVETRPVRGSTEHFYRRTETAVFDDESFLRMPDEVRRVVASTVIGDLVGQLTQAMQAGTLTAREDMHLTWRPLNVDEQGWGEVVSILESAFNEVTEVEGRAVARMAESGEEGLRATVALAGFESPPDA